MGFTVLPGPPFMHASAHWVGFHTMYTGGRIVIPPGGRFDPPAIWRLVSDEKVNLIVGSILEVADVTVEGGDGDNAGIATSRGRARGRTESGAGAKA